MILFNPGSRSQRRTECDGKSRSTLSVNRSSNDPSQFNPFEDGPLGRFYLEIMAEAFIKAAAN